MKIALIGYGKMGHIIEEIAKSRGHEVVCAIDIQNQEDFDSEAFRTADVAIEFTTPKTCLGNVRKCLERGVTVVVGSTGWYNELPKVEQEVKEANGALFWASNFSIGVNVFVAMQKYVARIMNNYPQYDVTLSETHHIHKLDSPSGTAIPSQAPSPATSTAKRRGKRQLPSGNTRMEASMWHAMPRWVLHSVRTTMTSWKWWPSVAVRCRASIR